ncbi:hypothetical protein GCM10008983_06630 [Lentibacillus halophilus]|uniref:Uncharacterized protein n=1 Tax=Lentibacillus halophilus TaxID=295065 RepID=A0ABN0Z489_9BACI
MEFNNELAMLEVPKINEVVEKFSNGDINWTQQQFESFLEGIKVDQVAKNFQDDYLYHDVVGNMFSVDEWEDMDSQEVYDELKLNYPEWLEGILVDVGYEEEANELSKEIEQNMMTLI